MLIHLLCVGPLCFQISVHFPTIFFVFPCSFFQYSKRTLGGMKLQICNTAENTQRVQAKAGNTMMF